MDLVEESVDVGKADNHCHPDYSGNIAERHKHDVKLGVKHANDGE